jgi:hypothetical protein
VQQAVLVRIDDIERRIGLGVFDIDSGNFIYFSDRMTIATNRQILLHAQVLTPYLLYLIFVFEGLDNQ